MKKILIIILLITTSCSEKLNDNYRGYVYNLKKEPLHNAKVYESVDSKKYVYTDKKGYFLLKPRSLNFVDDLIFEKEGYVTDTVYSYSASRRRDRTHFLTQRSDTVFMEEAKPITLPNNSNRWARGQKKSEISNFVYTQKYFEAIKLDEVVIIGKGKKIKTNQKKKKQKILLLM